MIEIGRGSSAVGQLSPFATGYTLRAAQEADNPELLYRSAQSTLNMLNTTLQTLDRLPGNPNSRRAAGQRSALNVLLKRGKSRLATSLGTETFVASRVEPAQDG
jgi:hypothetical protein